MAPRQQFGIWTLTFLVVANMIGAGVFTTSGFALKDLGSAWLVILAWLTGGVIAIAGAASYGRLARLIPESGGEYLFLSRLLHPLAGFLAGWISLVAGFTGAIAFAAAGVESYLMPETRRPAWLPEDSIAIFVLVLAGFIHSFRPRGGAAIQNVAVTIKLVLLATFLLLAAATTGEGKWLGGDMAQSPATNMATIAAFSTSLVWISLSYSGFNAAVYIAGEARDATKTVPRALLLGTTTVVVLYISLNAVFVLAPPPAEIVGRPDVGAIAAEWLGGNRIGELVRWMTALALLTSVSSMVMAGPRVYAKMAEDGFLPSRLMLRGEAPRWAIVLQIVLAAFMVLVSSLYELLSYLGLTLSLSAACTVFCLLLPRVRKSEHNRRFPLFAVIYVVATLMSATIMTIFNPWQLVGLGVTLVFGVLFFELTRKWGRSASVDDRQA